FVKIASQTSNRGYSYKFHLFSINDVVFLRMEEIIKEDKA
ncbi:hypothetical protein ECP03047775_3154, partial [Escherichia coli P0304777.5]